MNLFKNLMFLHGHFTNPRMDDGHDAGYGRQSGGRYGNRAANARALRAPWQGRGQPAVPPPAEFDAACCANAG